MGLFSGLIGAGVGALAGATAPTPPIFDYKAEGMNWLENYQKKIDRKRYGAPVGFCLPNGNCSCYVAIRNAQWSEGKMKIGAGCGIVPQSKLDLEWDEIQLKVKSIKNILGL